MGQTIQQPTKQTLERKQTTNDHVNEGVNNATPNGVGMNTTHGHKVEVADNIAAMKEVESANVLVTDANAYVAVELKEGNNGDEHMENKIFHNMGRFLHNNLPSSRPILEEKGYN